MTDPYAVRARTHRSDQLGRCKRCHKIWPCPRAGKADPEPRHRWVIAAAGVLGLAAACGLVWWWLP